MDNLRTMGEILRVPTITLYVDIFYAGEELLSGQIFLPALAHRHDGPTRADEWINDPSLFFPFVEFGTDRAILLNKDRVMVLTVPIAAEDGEEQAEVQHATSVRVTCGSKDFIGILRIEMPEGRTRVFDYLGKAEKFVALFDEERCHLIRKTYIDRVVEMREK